MNKKYFYITDSYCNTVTDSQVINKLQLLDNKNIVFDLIIISPISLIIKNYTEYKKNISYGRKNIKGNVFQIPILKSNDQSGISSLIKFFSLLIILIPHVRKNIIIQTRSIRDYKSLKMIKFFYKGVKILFDFRGAISEEYINSLNYRNINEVNIRSVRRKYFKLIDIQNKMFQLSNKIFCVSNKMKNYVNKYFPNKDKIIVVPGAADSNQFYFDISLRNQFRKNMNISSSERIIVYSGRLDSFYCIKEEIFLLVSKILKSNSNYKFLCLTPDLKSAKFLIKKNNLNKNKVILKHACYEDVNSYLNASDYGILIRKNIQTNYVSSPTKVSEYLLAGLPIIISENIGDFSKYISDNNFGIIINDNINKSLALINEQSDSIYEIDREYLSLQSGKYFSKQVHMEKLTSFYKNI